MLDETAIMMTVGLGVVVVVVVGMVGIRIINIPIPYRLYNITEPKLNGEK